MKNFYGQVEERLRAMTEEEKDSWILTVATHVRGRDQDRFLMSLRARGGGSGSGSEAGGSGSPLAEDWEAIRDLLADLALEPYLDDQLEFDQIWEIVETRIREGGFEKEPWELKEKILRELYANDFYIEYGIEDPMQDLERAMCVSEEEKRKREVLRRQFRIRD